MEQENNITAIIRPLVTAEEAAKAMEEYQKLLAAICSPEDFLEIEDQGKVHTFKKKTVWRKISKFSRISTEIISEKEEIKNVVIRTLTKQFPSKYGGIYTKVWKEVEYYPEDYIPPTIGENEELKKTIVVKVVVRAKAPNIDYSTDGDGSCDTWEKGIPKKYHDVRATAVTRAKNRAISDLVGFGEVSAEEIVGETNEIVEERIRAQNSSGNADIESIKSQIKTIINNPKFTGSGKYRNRGVNLDLMKKVTAEEIEKKHSLESLKSILERVSETLKSKDKYDASDMVKQIEDKILNDKFLSDKDKSIFIDILNSIDPEKEPERIKKLNEEIDILIEKAKTEPKENKPEQKDLENIY